MRMKMSRWVVSVKVVSRLEMRALGREPQDSGLRVQNICLVRYRFEPL